MTPTDMDVMGMRIDHIDVGGEPECRLVAPAAARELSKVVRC